MNKICPTDNNIFSEEEKEILQEVMNIAFGKASADFTEVIDACLILSVPCITLIKAEKLSEYISGEINHTSGISIVEQSFWGNFKGMAFLIFPSQSGKKLVRLLEDGDKSLFESEDMAVLEREILIEVGNILIGACVGKLSELLNEVVTYSPPRVVFENTSSTRIAKNIFEPDSLAVIMKTVFSLDKEDVNGYLFLVARQESFNWLKLALNNFIEQYG